MFDRIYIKLHRGPLYNSPMFSSQPFLLLLAVLFWDIMLLEDPIPATEIDVSDTEQYSFTL